PGVSATMGALTPGGTGLAGACAGRFVSPVGPAPAAGPVCLAVARPQRHPNPGPRSEPARSPFFTTTDRPTHSASNHLLPSRLGKSGGVPLPGRRHQGFASHSQARQGSRPNRVCGCYGLGVHLGLLSTSSREDAVTFGYRPSRPGRARTFTLLTVALE